MTLAIVPRCQTLVIAIILFEGGLNLQWSRLKRQEAVIRGLIWDVRWRHQQVVVEAFEYGPVDGTASKGTDQPGPAADRSRELFAIVTLTRGRRVSPMRMGYELRAGDVAAVAIHTPDHAEAIATLERLGWHQVPKV